MPFGGCCVLLFGDPLQLRPVRGCFPWEEPRDPKHRKAHMLSSTWELFNPVILRTNHRQGKDLEYSQILERIRVGEVDENDFDELEKRVFYRNDPSIEDSSVFIYSQNDYCNQKNTEVMQRLEGIEYTVKAKVRHHVLKEYLSDTEREKDRKTLGYILKSRSEAYYKD